jgi:hypothetical protein
MIIIKHIKDGEVKDHMEFNKKIRAFRHAIYWLQKLRLKSDPFLLFNQQPYSIPDSVLFQITCEHDSKRFLQSFELHQLTALKNNQV